MTDKISDSQHAQAQAQAQEHQFRWKMLEFSPQPSVPPTPEAPSPYVSDDVVPSAEHVSTAFERLLALNVATPFDDAPPLGPLCLSNDKGIHLLYDYHL